MKTIRKLFPFLFPAYNIIRGFLYDGYLFIKYNTNNNYKGNQKKHSAILIRGAHGLEKAFSLPSIKEGFGQASCLHLIKEVEEYYLKYGYSYEVRISLDILVYYKEFHMNRRTKDFESIFELIDNSVNNILEYDRNLEKIGGAKTIKKSNIEAMNKEFNYKKFSELRYSIRDFCTKQSVSDEIITKSVKLALKTPSACNRQAWKVHCYRDEKAKKILKFQNGNKGFNESINTVLYITGLRTSFANLERNSLFIDGGLFSMSLMNSLHSFSIGSCPLNTTMNVSNERALHQEMNIPNEEAPIMMLAIGHIKEEFEVSMSPRKQYNEVLTIYDQE